MPLKWIRKHIIADGNCFFRAIYNSAIESGNIKKIIKSVALLFLLVYNKTIK